jgi:2-polyprenyl-3-methyl-5-hydroxy-6-metoxy-1,4-benzoquinol methylase
MTDSITSKWNARYAYSGGSVPPPAQVLSRGARWLPAVSPGDEMPALNQVTIDALSESRIKALDLACGRAGNAQWMAERGFVVSAWDISDAVIDEIKSRKPRIIHDIQCRDVVSNPPEQDMFDVIVVAKFLERGICPALSSALKSGGVLFYQTFMQGLSNADYMLKPMELPELFADLIILEHDEPVSCADGKIEARLVAQKP